MNTIEDVKNKIAEFSDKTFGEERPYTAPLHHLKKEVDECIEGGDIYEYADCVLLLLDSYRKRYPDFSTQTLLDVCVEKIEIAKKRTWGDPDENGVIEHIRK